MTRTMRFTHEEVRLLAEGMAEIYDSGNFDRDDLTAIQRLLGRLGTALGTLNHAAGQEGKPKLLSRRL